MGLACGPKLKQDTRASTPAIATDTRAQLEALGYISVSEEAVDPARVGVVRADLERAQAGYNLYCNRNEGRGELIDMEGRSVQTWLLEDARYWASCKLLKDGSLLIVGVDLDPDDPDRKDDRQRYLMTLNWNGEIRWKKRIPVHHYATLTSDGLILALGLDYRSVPEIDPDAMIRDDVLLLIDLDGNVLERRSVYEAFASNEQILSLEPHRSTHKWGRLQHDLIHSNTAEFVDHPHLVGRHPLYAPGNVLLTSRRQNTIAMIEWQSNELLWAWGQGEILGPHDATVLENGNILLFDNGNKEREWSRVIELDPLEGEVVWSYGGDGTRRIFTLSRGTCQRLANGNTLITESNEGRAIEVTRAGDIVWEFLNPHLTPDNRRPSMGCVERYPSEYVDDILALHGRLDPATGRALIDARGNPR
jgi:outer membrane protein assembly factor BamB